MSATIVVPEFGESIVAARVSRWLKQPGDPVAAGEPVVELETDKVNVEVAAEQPGVLARIARREGEDVKPGDVLAVLEPEAAAFPSGSAPTPAAVSPLARRLAEEHGVDLAAVSGSGPGGRITREDVARHLEQRDRGEAAAPPAQPAPPAEPAPPPIHPAPTHPATPVPPEAPRGAASRRAPAERRERMSVRRLTVARRLLEAQQTAAMLTTFNDVDMGAVMDLRRRTKEALRERHGVAVGIVAFFVKAAVAALRAFPVLNAEVQGEEIVYKETYDIGVAIGAEEGLVVPVVRDADRKSLIDIEREIDAYADAARAGRLSLDDLRGGTFTITNGGVFGSLLSTPILNPPQVGILGLHRIEDRPVARRGQVVVRPMMYLALTYDHRIVDGRDAVQFLARVRELIEDPERLLLEA